MTFSRGCGGGSILGYNCCHGWLIWCEFMPAEDRKHGHQPECTGHILGACGRPHSLEYPQPDDNSWNKIDNKIKLCEWRPESRGAARGTEKPGLRALSTWAAVTLCPEHFRSVPGGNFTVESDQTADFTVGPWQDRGRIFFFKHAIRWFRSYPFFTGELCRQQFLKIIVPGKLQHAPWTPGTKGQKVWATGWRLLCFHAGTEGPMGTLCVEERVCGGLPLSSDRGTQYKHFHLWFAKDHLRWTSLLLEVKDEENTASPPTVELAFKHPITYTFNFLLRSFSGGHLSLESILSPRAGSSHTLHSNQHCHFSHF